MSGAAKKYYERPYPSQASSPRGEESPKRNCRILVVEDEIGIAEAYRDILAPPSSNVVPMARSSRVAAPPPASDASKGEELFELTVVHNAEQAIAAVKKSVADGQPFTMGFFDVLLGGGMDGIELVKHVHEVDPNVYAVFVTAYSDRSVDSIQSFLGEGQASRWDYLTKPFTRGEILQKARNGVAHWNLKREKDQKDQRLAALQKQLLEHERYATMAVVARGIGHEFRNILTSIVGKAELANSPTKTVDQMRETFSMILSASRRATEVLNRFSHLHNPSEADLAKKFLFADQPVEEALALMSHELKSHSVQVCWIRRKKLVVHANATALMQVFMNLVINSIHAMKSSGQIDISVAEVGGQAEIRFRDYGPGIDRQIIEQVTQPFFTTKGENGSGLGLAIAKEIVEGEHGGTFTLANHVVKGLEVVVTLPMEEAVVQPAQAGEE